MDVTGLCSLLARTLVKIRHAILKRIPSLLNNALWHILLLWTTDQSQVSNRGYGGKVVYARNDARFVYSQRFIENVQHYPAKSSRNYCASSCINNSSFQASPEKTKLNNRDIAIVIIKLHFLISTDSESVTKKNVIVILNKFQLVAKKRDDFLIITFTWWKWTIELLLVHVKLYRVTTWYLLRRRRKKRRYKICDV